MGTFLNSNCYWFFPFLLALQVIILILAVKKRNSVLFGAVLLLGFLSMGLITLLDDPWFDIIHALFRLAMPYLYSTANLVAIGIRAGMRDVMPSKFRWDVLFFVYLALSLGYIILQFVKLALT